MKKLCVLLVILSLLLTVGVALADTEYEADGWRYSVNDAQTEATILAYLGSDSAVTIPDTLGDVPVTVIGQEAFKDNTSVTKVTFAKKGNLTTIGEAAFAGCTALKSISLPDSLTTLGEQAFALTGLTSVTIPKGLTEIPAYCFASCSALKSVTVPKTVQAIGDYAFYNCPKLSSVKLNEGLVSIGAGAFSGDADYLSSIEKGKAYALKSVSIPASVESIGDSAFAYQDALTTITFAKKSKLTAIPTGLAYGCESLKSVTLPDSVSIPVTYDVSAVPQDLLSLWAATGMLPPDKVESAVMEPYKENLSLMQATMEALQENR